MRGWYGGSCGGCEGGTRTGAGETDGPAMSSLTTPARTRNSSRVISPSVGCRWAGGGSAAAAPPNHVMSRQTSSTVFWLSVRGRVSDTCLWTGAPAACTAGAAVDNVVEVAPTAWDSSAVQMLRRSSSMFKDPKSFSAPPRVLWNSSNVSEYTDPCRKATPHTSCFPLTKTHQSNHAKTPRRIRTGAEPAGSRKDRQTPDWEQRTPVLDYKQDGQSRRRRHHQNH
ncbi:hypothetical protein GUJ93_ZPchr0002g24014 [Zizania palustris]|uniref:Uncharacterized protein n=1 Tax=Zizania palustris TaxID=103762 RepID=A0A8J5SJS1_ZIZPA|nr:hypothetical protein GUJ93_ZPchr0002g24014 [Zizania palustris]